MQQLEFVEIFLEVSKTKSFSRAAENLRMSRSHISKCIQALEYELKCDLFVRNTRKVALTEYGLSLFQSSYESFEKVKQSLVEIKENKNQLSGKLKILAPKAFGNIVLSKFLCAFLRKYQDIKIEIQLNTHIKDFMTSGFDIAIRTKKPTDQNLMVKKIAELKSFLYAKKEYLETHQSIKNLKDLKKQHFCTFEISNTDLLSVALFSGGKEHHVEIQNQVICNSLELMKTLILSKDFIGILPEFMFDSEELERFGVQKILPEYHHKVEKIYAVFSKHKFENKKIETFIRELEEFVHSPLN